MKTGPADEDARKGNCMERRKPERKRLNIKTFNRGICVCALPDANSIMRKEQCRNEEKA